MIKLNTREMKNLSRILIVCLGVIPAFSAGGAPVATTSGSNLTAFNPSTANNNQWATMTNGRYDTNTSAKVDFGNCNAVVLRCAQPKCGNGGCTDYTIAEQIVAGCVKSNDKCKQYGDDLINFMTAQLVSSSNAKLNQQQMQLEQARIQAEAQAAAAASNAQSEQISQMQNQMYQMQQQMAQQQAESAQQLQAALSQQAAQSAAALEEMKSAATAAAQQTEAGITSYQQEAINRGISEDVLARQQITGQVMTEIENADVSLKAVQTAMQNAFNYAGCDARGNNCTGPKRVKKWRELATGFIDPYDNTIDKIYDALIIAQTVGVDLSQIYMMLNDSCNSWGQYLCPAGTVVYPTDDNSGDVPKVCRSAESQSCYQRCQLESFGRNYNGISYNIATASVDTEKIACKKACDASPKTQCQKCRLLKVLTDGEDVYEGWINAEETSNDQRTVVACASGALNSSALFARRTKNKNGAGLVDIDKLDTWLHQTEPTVKTEAANALKWCYNPSQEDILKSSISSRSVPAKNQLFCVEHNGSNDNFTESKDEKNCPYIAGTYAICDTHLFNAGKTEIPTNTEKMQEIKDATAMKVTVISQQMYKQYEYLNATLRRLKTQLEKAVLTSNLEAAGAKSDGSSSGGLAGGRGDSDKTIYLAGAENCSNRTSTDSAYQCIQTNVSLIISSAASNKTNACKQLQATIDSANLWAITKKAGNVIQSNDGKDMNYCKNIMNSCNKESAISCAQELNALVIQKKESKQNQQQMRGYNMNGWTNQGG